MTGSAVECEGAAAPYKISALVNEEGTSFYMDRRADDFASVFSRWKKVRDGLAATWFDHTLPARSWTWIAGDRSLEKSEF